MFTFDWSENFCFYPRKAEDGVFIGYVAIIDGFEYRDDWVSDDPQEFADTEQAV